MSDKPDIVHRLERQPLFVTHETFGNPVCCVMTSETCKMNQEERMEAASEIKHLRAELSALKAHDPLAEMWRELAEYQPQADRDGHGESWARMCSERTAAAARSAAWYAADAASSAADAADAASSAADAARDVKGDAACAVAEIRRAKEVQR